MRKKFLFLSVCMLVVVFLPGCRETSEKQNELPKQKDEISLSEREETSAKQSELPEQKDEISLSEREETSAKQSELPKQKDEISLSERKKTSKKQSKLPKQKNEISLSEREETLENHSALSMQEDGFWEERYHSCRETDSGEVHAEASINVKKDMSEKEMLKILDYYSLELVEASAFHVKKEEAPVYGVFYKGNTDEEIGRFKYINGKSVDISEKEQYYFPAPIFHNQDVE